MAAASSDAQPSFRKALEEVREKISTDDRISKRDLADIISPTTSEQHPDGVPRFQVTKRIAIPFELEQQIDSALSVHKKTIVKLSSEHTIASPARVLIFSISLLTAVDVRSYMGLFPEIGYAWITVDERFYMWDFNSGKDIHSFTDLRDTIVSVALVKPNKSKDVFREDVTHLIILATALEVSVLAIRTGPRRDISLHPTSYACPTDRVIMMDIVGHSNGRVFMCGADGCIYELIYTRDEPSWRSLLPSLISSSSSSGPASKCRKLNHSVNFVSRLASSLFRFSSDDSIDKIAIDDKQNILYSLSSKSVIEMYDLGADGLSLTKSPVSFNLSDLVASGRVAAISGAPEPQIVSIAPLTPDDSSSLGLMAVLTDGRRLYFKTRAPQSSFTPSSYSTPPAVAAASSSSSSPPLSYASLSLAGIATPSPALSTPPAVVAQRPNRLEAVAGRDVPSYFRQKHSASAMAAASSSSASASIAGASATPMPSIACVHTCHLAGDITILCDKSSEESDAVVCISYDYVPIPAAGRASSSTPVTSTALFTRHEFCDVLELFGRTRSIAEIQPNLKSSERLVLLPRMQIHELASQFFFPARQFVRLSRKGIHVMAKLRPIDQLRQILRNDVPSVDLPEKPVKITSFLQRYGEDEGFCMLLALAAQLFSEESKLQRNQLRAAFGLAANGLPHTERDSVDVVRKATDILNLYGGKPRSQQPAGEGIASASSEVTFSAFHNAFYLFASRLISPLFDAKIVKNLPTPEQLSKPGHLDMDIFAVTPSQLEELYGRLTDLHLFMTSYGFNINPVTPSSASSAAGPVNSAAPSDAAKAQYAKAEEDKSLHNLFLLISRTRDTVALLYLLCNRRRDLLAVSRKDRGAILSTLSTFTFRDLLRTQDNTDLVKRLVRSIALAEYDHTAVSQLCQYLESHAVSLYTTLDLAEIQAFGQMKLAKVAPSDTQRVAFLSSALEKYKEAAGKMSDRDLMAIRDEFLPLKFHKGAVALALTAAEKKDPSNKALVWWKGKRAASDDNQKFFLERQKCYALAVEILDELLQPSSAAPSSSIVTRLTPAERHSVISQVMLEFLNSADQLAHFALYSYYKDDRQEWPQFVDILAPLEGAGYAPLISPPPKHVEEFLEKTDTVALAYYLQRIRKYEAAARKFDELASRVTSDSSPQIIPISSRVTFLMEAQACAKLARDPKVLQDASEKLIIANLQRQLVEELLSTLQDGDAGKQAMVKKLNSMLYAVAPLVLDFAFPLKLWESALALLNFANTEHNLVFRTRVREIWRSLLERILYSPGPTELLESKLPTLAKLYYPDPTFFPVSFLASALEKVCLEQGWTATLQTSSSTIVCSFAVHALAESVPFDACFAAYVHLWQEITGQSRAGSVMGMSGADQAENFAQDAPFLLSSARVPDAADPATADRKLQEHVIKSTLALLEEWTDTVIQAGGVVMPDLMDRDPTSFPTSKVGQQLDVIRGCIAGYSESLRNPLKERITLIERNIREISKMLSETLKFEQ